MEEKKYIYIRQYALIGFFGYNLKQICIERQLESIDLSANNVNFVTKDEFESNFLSKLTEESKLNHWVNNILN